MQRLLYSAIWVGLDLAGWSPAETNRKAKLQFAAFRFLADRLEGTLAQQVQLELTHRSLQAKQQAIVDDAGIVDPIRIHNHSIRQPTQFDEMMPIATIAC